VVSVGVDHGIYQARPHRPRRVAHLPWLHELWQGDRGNHAWSLGEKESPFIKRALEAGINFFDAANRYSVGSSEEILGHAINDFARRDEVVIATKVYGRIRGDRTGMGSPAKRS
jgi:aryl-alcohol dehydrogenase-like predicted oxidoreductase